MYIDTSMTKNLVVFHPVWIAVDVQTGPGPARLLRPAVWVKVEMSDRPLSTNALAGGVDRLHQLGVPGGDNGGLVCRAGIQQE